MGFRAVMSTFDRDDRDDRALTGIFSHIPVSRKASIHAGFDRFWARLTGMTGIPAPSLTEKRKEEEKERGRRTKKKCPNIPVIPVNVHFRDKNPVFMRVFRQFCLTGISQFYPVSALSSLSQQ